MKTRPQRHRRREPWNDLGHIANMPRLARQAPPPRRRLKPAAQSVLDIVVYGLGVVGALYLIDVAARAFAEVAK
jgi:hypothetical protein